MSLITANGRHVRVIICRECFCLCVAEHVEQHQQRCSDKIEETPQ
jgi:hypothetical protein